MDVLVRTSICFVFMLLLCHLPIAWIKVRRKGRLHDKDAWAVRCEQLDYVYLALATIALIPAAYDVGRHFSKESARSLAYHVVDPSSSQPLVSLRAQPREASEQTRMLHEYLDSIEADLKSSKADCTAALNAIRGDQYKLAETKAISSRNAIQAVVQVRVPEKITDPALLRDLEGLRWELGLLHPLPEMLLASIREVRKYDLGTSFIEYGPYFLALGLALRFTKTSIKLLIEAQKRLPKDDSKSISHNETIAPPPASVSGHPSLPKPPLPEGGVTIK